MKEATSGSSRCTRVLTTWVRSLFVDLLDVSRWGGVAPSTRSTVWVVSFVIAGWVSGWGAGVVEAQVSPERVDEFLRAARERGYYDVAEYYLETLEKSPRVAAGIKSEIPFRRAELLFEKTRTLNNISELREAWGEAARIAQEQLQQSANLDRRIQAVQLISQIHTGLAEYQRRQAKLPWEQLAESQAEAVVARAELEQAGAAYEKGAELLLEELKEARRSSDAARRAAFADNSYRFLAMLLSKLLVDERIAFTFPANSTEYKTRMEALLAQSEEHATKYRSQVPYDVYFQLYRMRALMRLDRWREVAPLVDDVLLLENPIYRAAQREVALVGFEVWFKESPAKIELALAQLDRIVRELSEADQQTEVGQKLLLALAKTHHARTEWVAGLERPTSEQRTGANSSSRLRAEYARRLVKMDSPLGAEARELLNAWGVRGPAEQVSEVSTFAEAKQMGLDALLEAIELKTNWSALDAETQALPENQTMQTDSIALADQALRWLDRSLELARDDTRRVELNMVRLYQCQAYWVKDYHLETALIGQFLLDRFPNELGTAEAAALAAQALSRLVIDRKAAGDPVDVEQRQMVHVCNQVLDKWPERKETGDVAYMLISTELDRGQFAAAEDVLKRLSVDNPRRALAELRLGISQLQQAESLARRDDATSETAVEISALKKQAEGFLADGLGRPESEVGPLHFVAAAALAQLWNDQQRYEEAITLLEQSNVAPLPRIERGEPGLSDSNVQTNLIQSGVIAYMGQMGQTGDLAGTTDRVVALMALLNQRLATNPRGSQILQSYYSLTLRKLRELAQGDLTPAAKANLADATLKIFEPILAPSQDWRLVSILAETLYELSSGLGDESAAIRDRVLEFSSQSYEKALQLTAAVRDEPSLPALRTSFQAKLAGALRRQGRYQAAETKLKEQLRTQPKNPLVQIELCLLYQDWGIASKDRGHLRVAIMGQGKGTDAEMWGWQKLAQATITDSKNRDTFYTALYGLAMCRFQFGKLAGDAKYVEAALKVIRDQWGRDQTMGGAESYDRFDRLTKEIQTQMRQTAGGLKAL